MCKCSTNSMSVHSADMLLLMSILCERLFLVSVDYFVILAYFMGVNKSNTTYVNVNCAVLIHSFMFDKIKVTLSREYRFRGTEQIKLQLKTTTK